MTYTSYRFTIWRRGLRKEPVMDVKEKHLSDKHADQRLCDLFSQKYSVDGNKYQGHVTNASTGQIVMSIG